MESCPKNQPALPVVAYDAFHYLHAGPATSAESPDRVRAIVEHLRALEGIEWHILNSPIPVVKTSWSQSITLNCSACTSPLDKGKLICPVCYSTNTNTNAWNYVGDILGDTTYQTPYTALIVERAAQIVKNEMNQICSMRGPSMTFALTRPPGHHACSGKRVGFCHHNFAIDALDVAHKLGKTALILDIDAHHGDGTETEIKRRGYGYYCSLHAFGPTIYPGTGSGSDSTDQCLNIALASAIQDVGWISALTTIAGPWIQSKKPDVIILSCGFDAHTDDLLAPLHVTSESYKSCSQFLKELKLPVLAILEGGYHIPVLGECVSAILGAYRLGGSSPNLLVSAQH